MRAGTDSDNYSVHQCVEPGGMNVICIGGRGTGYALA